MVETEHLFPAKSANNAHFLITVPSNQVLLVWSYLQSSQPKAFGAIVGSKLLHELDIANLSRTKYNLINLQAILERTLPHHKMISILCKQEILGIERVGVELMHAFPALWASIVC